MPKPSKTGRASSFSPVDNTIMHLIFRALGVIGTAGVLSVTNTLLAHGDVVNGPDVYRATASEVAYPVIPPESWIGDLRIVRQEEVAVKTQAPSPVPAHPAQVLSLTVAQVTSKAPIRVAPPAPKPAAPAPPAMVIGSAQQSLINSDRTGSGLRGLTWSSCLGSIAAQQARAMATAGSIFHGAGVNQDWGCHLGSVQTGENVGEWGGGINDSAINSLFMASSPHRANIMGPYHYVGTAWVLGANGVGYIAVEFA